MEYDIVIQTKALQKYPVTIEATPCDVFSIGSMSTVDSVTEAAMKWCEQHGYEYDYWEFADGHCNRCGKAVTSPVIDPFDFEVYEEENWVWLCNECYCELEMAV